MSEKLRPSQFADNKSVIVESFVPNTGLLMEGPTVPANALAGYSAGAIFVKRAGAAGAQVYINEGSATSCLFLPLQSQGSLRIARGQQTTVSAVDTVVTGLNTVASVVVSLESDPTDTCGWTTGQIGNQSGAPAAGSIVIKTWMVTTGGTAGNPTQIAATSFSKKVNWIAIGS